MTSPTSKKTFDNQSLLPSLPVPPLAHTQKVLLHSLKPFCRTADEYKTVAALLDDFNRGLGVELQRRLEQHATSVQPPNWLDEWWLKLAYHSWREPLPVNSNWFMVFADHPEQPRALLHPKLAMVPHGHVTHFQIHRSAGFITTALDMKDAIERGTIAPETMNRGKTPLCMHQYKLMFGWTRVPKLECDYNVCPGGFPNTSRHVTVLFRDQVFSVPVYDIDGRRVAVADIERQLWQCVNDAVNTKPQPPVCVLTGDHRDDWSRAREHLYQLDAINRQSLADIEASLFCLSLDDWSNPDQHDFAYRNMAHGINGHNRWYDKAISVVCSSEGKGGMNGEHSPCDALIPSRLMDWMVVNEPAQDPVNCAKDSLTLPAPRKLAWVVDKVVELALAHAHQTVTDIVRNSDAGVLIFDGYGSDFIKQFAKVSPDAYVQMALQLAYYRMHGTWTATYETGSTRKFLYGRTETIRSCSPEACAFVTQFTDANLAPNKKFEALQKACAAHSQFTTMTMQGMGADRHLLGLRCVMKQSESHALFNNPAIKESTNFRLSTSSLNTGENFNGTGFGAVTPDGYGTNYCIGPRVMKFGVESKKQCRSTSTAAFKQALVKAFSDMRTLCENVNGATARM